MHLVVPYRRESLGLWRMFLLVNDFVKRLEPYLFRVADDTIEAYPGSFSPAVFIKVHTPLFH